MKNGTSKKWWRMRIASSNFKMHIIISDVRTTTQMNQLFWRVDETI